MDVKNVTLHIGHDKKHAVDCEQCEDTNAKIDTFTRKITLDGNRSAEQKKHLLEIAERCPVHKTLSDSVQIVSELLSPNR